MLVAGFSGIRKFPGEYGCHRVRTVSPTDERVILF